MPDYPQFREILKAVALGDSETASRLDDEIRNEERESYNIYVTAMFCGAVGHRFESDQSRNAVARFVEELRYDYRNIDPPVKPLAMEGTIRAVFGEDHLLDEVSGAEQLRHQFLAIRKIVLQSDHMRQHLDDYLTDAQLLAEAWTAGEG